MRVMEYRTRSMAKAVQTRVPGPQLRELVLQGRELPVGGARRWRGRCGSWAPAQAAHSVACQLQASDHLIRLLHQP